MASCGRIGGAQQYMAAAAAAAAAWRKCGIIVASARSSSN